MHILLVRHGETAWNHDGRYQGRTDVPLSPDGERQARALGERLARVPLKLAISSPLGRARTTAQTVLAGRNLDLELEAGLLEISHGEWEGQLATDITRQHPAMFAAWKGAPTRDMPAGPGAETLGQVEARAWPVFTRACARLAEDEVGMIAAHDAVNRVLLCRVLGLPLTQVWTFRQAPATLNVLSGSSVDTLQVVRLNDADHVAPLFAEPVHRAV